MAIGPRSCAEHGEIVLLRHEVAVMTSERNDQPIERLATVVAELYRGNWRAATTTLSEGGDMSDRPELVEVAFCLRCVTRCISFQSVLADVEAASHQIDTALRTLHRHPRARLAAEPSQGRSLDHLLWSTNRLAQRERADLDALRRIFAGLRRGRPELVYACVEHLTSVEFDPWTVAVHPLDRELTGLDDDTYARWREGNRRDICARATHLRQFADVRKGSVNVRTWQRAGGYPCLRAEALRVLAGEPVTRGRTDLPVRLGRRRAWNYARDWLGDTAA